MRGGRIRGHRLLLAAVAAIAIAEAAVLVLRPRHGLIAPTPLDVDSFFAPSQIARAQSFRDGQLYLWAGAKVAQGALLALLVLRPGIVERASSSIGRGRVVLATCAGGAAIVLAFEVVALPFAAAGHARAVDYGLSVQSWPAWLADRGKSVGIAVVMGAAGAAALTGLMRRFRRWWLPAAGAAVAIEALFVLLAPIVLDPLFNRFEPLRGTGRQAVLDVAERAGVKVRRVDVVDASRRTTTSNAYVTGFGPTKRVVIYDNVLNRFPQAEVDSVVAHELAHAKYHDMLLGLLFAAIVTPAGMLVVQRTTEALASRSGRSPGGAGSLPAAALSLAIVSFCGTIFGNQLSRAVEARADGFALRVTENPKAAIALDRRLALDNLSDPDPPAALVWFFGTHPTTMERIGSAVTYEREEKEKKKRSAG